MSQLERLTIYLIEGKRWQGKLLYRSLMKTACYHGIAGMTVSRGAVGYSRRNRHRISVDWIIELSMYMPIIVVVIDTADAIAVFLAQTKDRINGGIIVQETVEVVYPAAIDSKTAQSSFLREEQEMTDFERLD